MKTARDLDTYLKVDNQMFYWFESDAHVKMCRALGNTQTHGLVTGSQILEYLPRVTIGSRSVTVHLCYREAIFSSGPGDLIVNLYVYGSGILRHLSIHPKPLPLSPIGPCWFGARGKKPGDTRGKKIENVNKNFKNKNKPKELHDNRSKKEDIDVVMNEIYPNRSEFQHLHPCVNAFLGKKCAHQKPRSVVCKLQCEQPKKRVKLIVDTVQKIIDEAPEEEEKQKEIEKAKKEKRKAKKIEAERKKEEKAKEEKEDRLHIDVKFREQFSLPADRRDNRILDSLTPTMRRLLVFSALPHTAHVAKLDSWLAKARLLVLNSPSKARMYCEQRRLLAFAIGMKCCSSHADLCSDPDLNNLSSQRTMTAGEMALRSRTTEIVPSNLMNTNILVQFDNPSASFWFCVNAIILAFCFALSYWFGEPEYVLVPGLAMLTLLPSITKSTVVRTSSDRKFQNEVAAQQLAYDTKVNMLAPTAFQSANERKDVEMLYRCTLSGVEVESVNHLPPGDMIRNLLFMPFGLAIWLSAGWMYSGLSVVITYLLYRQKPVIREIVSLELLAAFNSGSCKTVSETMVDYLVSCKAIIRNYVNLIDTAQDSLGRKMASNLADGTLRIARFFFHRQQLANLEAEGFLNGIGGAQGHSLVWQGMGLMTSLQQQLMSLITLESIMVADLVVMVISLLHQGAPNMTQILLLKLLSLSTLTVWLIPTLISLTHVRPWLARFTGFWGRRLQPILSPNGNFADSVSIGYAGILSAMQSVATYCGSMIGSRRQTTLTNSDYSLSDYSLLPVQDFIGESEEYFPQLENQIPLKQPLTPSKNGGIKKDKNSTNFMDREVVDASAISSSESDQDESEHLGSFRLFEPQSVIIASGPHHVPLIGHEEYLTDPDSEELVSLIGTSK